MSANAAFASGYSAKYASCALTQASSFSAASRKLSSIGCSKPGNEPTQFDKIKLRAVEQFCAARGRTAGTGCQQRRDRTQEHREKKNGQNLAPCSKFHKYAPFTLSTIIGRRNNVDLFCRFIIARHNKKTKEFSEILFVSYALPHRGQYPQSEYGRHLQFVQAASKTHKPIASVADLTAQPLAALPPYGCGVPFRGVSAIGSCKF